MSFSDGFARGEFNAFFELQPGDTASALNLSRTINPELASALKRYANALNAPKATFQTIETLRNPKTRAIVTGQQAGLLLGPNYTLSKAITAIHLAKELSTKECPVVPMFWVASQDHDVEEVNHAYVMDMNETLHRLELPLPQNTPIGKIPLQPVWVQTIIDSMKDLKIPETNKSACISLLQESATVSKTFADWFAAILYRLLGHQGLIIINPLEADIAPLFKPILEAEIKNPSASSTAINLAGKRLFDLGHEPQLNRAEQATNLFLEEDSKRQLLKFDGKLFSTDATHYTAHDLIAILQNEPARITPAAGLRPIVQDSILPTAITVLGPGELRYFAQIKDVYKLHGIPMSLTWPRATATILEPPVVRIMKKFALGLHDLTRDFHGIKEHTLLELHGYGIHFSETHQTLEASLLKLCKDLNHIDPTLLGTLKRSEGYVQKSLEILKQKTAKALEKQDSITTQQFDRLEKHLFPLNTPQERLISPFSFFLKFGITPILQAFSNLPTSGDHTLIV
jgi:bacillithiol biosynthesis cysteine-adding enzyme BshC